MHPCRAKSSAINFTTRNLVTWRDPGFDLAMNMSFMKFKDKIISHMSSQTGHCFRMSTVQHQLLGKVSQRNKHMNKIAHVQPPTWWNCWIMSLSFLFHEGIQKPSISQVIPYHKSSKISQVWPPMTLVLPLPMVGKFVTPSCSSEKTRSHFLIFRSDQLETCDVLSLRIQIFP